MGDFQRLIVDRIHTDDQIGHRVAVAGVGERGAVEAQIEPAVDRRIHRGHEVRIVRAGGVEVGEAHINRRRFARLQCAGQTHSVARRPALDRDRIAAD